MPGARGGGGWAPIDTVGSYRPDDPSNPVLRVVASGATGHMHNHVVTTLGAPIEEREYRISFRARWVAGSNQPLPALLQPHGEDDPPSAAGTCRHTGTGELRLDPSVGPTGGALQTDPVVPEPSEPVTVSVHLEDPDGVAGATLFASVDGGAFFETPMESTGAATYAATLPGQAAVAGAVLRRGRG